MAAMETPIVEMWTKDGLNYEITQRHDNVFFAICQQWPTFTYASTSKEEAKQGIERWSLDRKVTEERYKCQST